MDAGGFPSLDMLTPLHALASLDFSSVADILGRGWSVAWTGLWMGGLAATLLASLVALSSRTNSMRPATRHALWLAVLVSFLTPPLVASVWRPAWFASERRVVSETKAVTPAPSATPTEAQKTLPSGPLATNLPNNAGDKNAGDKNDGDKNDGDTNTGESNAAAAHCDTSPTQCATTNAQCGTCPTQCDAGPTDCDTSTHAAAPTVSCEAPSPASTVDPVGLPPIGRDIAARTETPAAASLVAAPVTAPTAAPAPSPAPTAEPSPRMEPALTEPSPSQLQLWFLRLVDIRDAIAALPPMPLLVWAVGAAVIALIHASRIVRVRGIVRRAAHATPEIQREVHQVARSMGLERAPITLISLERISPLVWCGLRSRLVLPADLWETLDRAARRTVLVHELAHVRRSDHRICWLEAIVSALYWWHPIAWWARARLRDAAESACDTWVTSMCPQNRRSYAEALVLATSFLSSTTDRTDRARSAACASVSVGFVTGRSRRLARRITMVMTSRFAPRMSLVGSAACLVALGMGAFVAPSLACPPSQCDEQPVPTVKARAKARVRDVAPARPAQTAPHSTAGSPFVGEAPAIDAMGNPLSAATVAGQPVVAGHPVVVGQPLVAGHPVAIGQPVVAGQRIVLDGFGGTSPDVEAQLAYTTALGQNAETVARAYRLPEGKLDALVELMSRQDVPIYISTQDDAIVVNATPAQHEIFGAFVKMIHPEGAASGQRRMRGSAMSPLQALRSADAAKAGGAAELRSSLGQLKASRQQLGQMLREREAFERDAERYRDSAEQARERAEEMQNALESLNEQRSNMSRYGDATAEKALLDAMRSLESRAHAAEAEAKAIESKAESSEARMASMEKMMLDLESRIDDLTQALDSAGLTSDEEISDEAADAVAGEAMADAAEADEIAEAPEAPEMPEAPEAPESAASPAPAAAPLPPMPAKAPMPPAAASPARKPSMPLPPVPPVAPAGR